MAKRLYEATRKVLSPRILALNLVVNALWFLWLQLVPHSHTLALLHAWLAW